MPLNSSPTITRTNALAVLPRLRDGETVAYRKFRRISSRPKGGRTFGETVSQDFESKFGGQGRTATGSCFQRFAYKRQATRARKVSDSICHAIALASS